MEQIAKNFKKIRETLSLTQEEMAQKLDLSSSGCRNYEVGKRLPTTEVILKLIQMWRINANWLLTNKGSMFIQTENTLKKTDNRYIVLNFEKTVTNNIIKVQETNDLSNREMAKIMGISETTYLNICAGKIQPSIKEINRLKEHFDIDMELFLYGDRSESSNVQPIINNLPPLTPEQQAKFLKFLDNL